MKSVFVLHHSYELDSCEEVKLIGIYTSKEHAQATIDRLKTKKGFRDRPDDFTINEYELDKDGWTEGYSTLTSIQVKDINNNWTTTSAECLIDGTYQINEHYDNDKLGEFKHMDIVKGELIDGELYAVELIRKNEEQK